MVTFFFIDVYTPDDNNGICAYGKLLTPYLSGKKDMEAYAIFVRCPEYSQVTSYRKNNITFVYVPYDIAIDRRIGKNDIEFVDYLKELAKNNKVVVLLNWMNHAYITHCIKSAMPEAKVILTKHCVCWRENILKDYELYYDIQNTLSSQKNASFFIKRILGEEFSFFSLVDHIITVTDDAKNIVTKLYGVPGNRITRIYNGVANLSIISQTKTELRRKYRLPLDEIIILYVGALLNYKGLSRLFPIVNRLRDRYSSMEAIRLIVCGNGDFQSVMDSIPNELVGRITFMGNLSKCKLREFYKLADIGILPSLNDQCSYVALEMMQANLPLIVNEIPGLKELLSFRDAVFLPIKFDADRFEIDENSSVERIHKLLIDNSFRRRYIQSIQQAVSNQFSADKMCEDTYRVIKNISEINNGISFQEIAHYDVLVSVVMSCYNAESTIMESIESVLNQTGVSLELIIIDDGSTDNSIETIQNIDDRRIKLIRNPVNKGVTASLNMGICVSNGKYIARIDADDVMLPHRLWQQVSFLERNTDYDIVGGNMMIMDTRGYPIKAMSFPEKYEEIKWLRYLMNPFAHPATMIRKSVFEKYKYSEEFSYCEDYDLWYKVLDESKGYNIQHFMINYRLSKNSVSHKNIREQNENALLLSIRQCEKLFKRDMSDQEMKYLAAIHLGAPKEYWTRHKEGVMKFVRNIASANDVTLDNIELSTIMKALEACVI